MPSRTSLTGLLAVLVTATAAGAQTGDRPVLSGSVTGPEGAPLPGASVAIGIHHVQNPDGRNACAANRAMLEVASTTTDGAGRFAAAIPLHPESAEANCLRVWAGGTTETGAAVTAEPADFTLDAVPASIDLVAEPLPESSRLRTPDTEAADIARTTVPGFAGIYIERCDLVVVLTDVERHGAAARAHGERLIGERTFSTGCARPPEVRLREVRYDAIQLLEWRGRAGLLFALAGSKGLGIDTRANRVSVSFTSPTARRRAERALATLDIPADAIELEAPETEPQLRDFGPEETRLGTPIAPRENINVPTWSLDGREIVWAAMVSRREMQLRAVDVVSGEIRDITRRPVPAWGTGRLGVVPSADGEWIYFSASSPRRPDRIYRVPAGGGEAEEVELGIEPGIEGFRFAPGEERLAYLRRQADGQARVTVVDLVTGETTDLPDRFGDLTGIAGFSPDGTSLLLRVPGYRDSVDGGFWHVNLRTGEARHLVLLRNASAENVLALRWEDGSPRLLLAEGDPDAGRVTLSEVASMEERRTIARLDGVEGDVRMARADWSDDGQTIALWSLVEQGPPACEVWGGMCMSLYAVHFRLDQIDAASGARTRIAEAAAATPPGWTSLSSDGSRLAYRWRQELYLDEIESGAGADGRGGAP